jgi:hypothetical protein
MAASVLLGFAAAGLPRCQRRKAAATQDDSEAASGPEAKYEEGPFASLRMTGLRYGADREQNVRINSMVSNPTPRSRAVSILTDMHFWVPAIVLLSGLLLLKFLH